MSNEIKLTSAKDEDTEPEVKADAFTVPADEDDAIDGAETYVHEFEEPFEWEGKTYEKLSFDFSKLRGKDVLAIMREIRMAGITVAARTFDVEYQYRYAARCCEPKIGSDVIAGLPAKDFDRICSRVQRFLLRSAL